MDFDCFYAGTVLLGAIGAFILFKFVARSKRVKMIDKIPGPDYHFIFGNTLQFRDGDIAKSMYKLVKNYYPHNLARLWFGTQAQIACIGAKAVEALLSNNKWLDKSNDYDFLLVWLGTGLLTSSGAKWHRRRKLLTPTFHFKILDDFLNVFNEQGDVLTSILDEQEAKGERFDISPFVDRCTLDVICETAMGKTINAQKNANSEYMKAIEGMAAVMQVRWLYPWLRNDFLFRLTRHYNVQKRNLNILHGFTNRVIVERQEEYKKRGPKKAEEDGEEEVFGRKRRLAFLDLLLENAEGNKLTQDDIREEVDTFMFEGHDTTASGLVWILYSIGRSPEVEEKLYEEIYTVLGDEPRDVTAEDIRNLKYLECVIKESFRLYPPVPFFGRQLKEQTEMCGYQLPADVNVTVSPYILHRDPKYFPDPEKFDPDRFLPENSLNRSPYAYVPFSAGPRNCIGQKFALMEEKVLVSKIVQKFKITSCHKPEEIKLLADLVLRPTDGMWLKLQKRN